MKQLLYVFIFFIGFGVEIDGYIIKLFNTTPYTANFFAHTKLAGCCYGDKVGGKIECRKELEGLTEGFINLNGICSLGCWTYADATVVIPNEKEVYLKRTVPFENEILGCGDARIFLFENGDGSCSLGNKIEYIAGLNKKLKKLFTDNGIANFLSNLKSKYENKIKEFGEQIGKKVSGYGSLGIGDIVATQKLLLNTLDYAQEYISVQNALGVIKKSANQNTADKLAELEVLEQEINNVPKKDSLVPYNQLMDTLKGTIYLSRLETAAQDQDKALLIAEMSKNLTFPHAPELAAEIKARIEATRKLYDNVPKAEEDEDSIYEWWTTKLSKPLNYDNAENDVCAIKNFIEKSERPIKVVSPDVDDLLQAIDAWKDNDVGRSYIKNLKSLIDQKLKSKNWNCAT